MRYFEDFKVGDVIELGSCSLSEADILAFARQFDPQPFHVDPVAAKESIFGGIIASGWHSCSLLMRLLVDGLLNDSAGLGSPGVQDVRFLLPVRPGDVLTARYTVEEAIPSKSKPDRGVIASYKEMRNARGELVLSMRSKGMFKRRP